jgi:hypothetical protein
MADAIAYFWNARVALEGAWSSEVKRFVGAVPGIALDVVDDQDARIGLSDGIHDKVEFNFARRRGGGTVNLSSGPRLILVSLGIAARLKLELSDGNANAFAPSEPRSWLSRIPFTESVLQIEALAEEVGLLPKRARLEELAAALRRRPHGSIFFS